MSSMFALIVPGQLVQPIDQDPSSPERFLSTITHTQPLNHITVFMTGAAPFPEGYGCTLHLFLPDKGWQTLGFLSNAKPSAIFRIRPTATHASAFSSAGLTGATLGVLCEPLDAIAPQVAALGAGGAAKADVSDQAGAAGAGAGTGALVLAREAAPVEAIRLATGIGRNLFNMVGGCAQPFPPESGMKGSWIPLEVIEKWYSNFERKLKTVGVSFLLNQD